MAWETFFTQYELTKSHKSKSSALDALIRLLKASAKPNATGIANIRKEIKRIKGSWRVFNENPGVKYKDALDALELELAALEAPKPSAPTGGVKLPTVSLGQLSAQRGVLKAPEVVVKPPTPLRSVGLGTPRGWALEVWDELTSPTTYFATPMVALVDRVPALSNSEIARVNEAMGRAKAAAEGARDAVIKVRGNWAGTTAEHVLYKEYFGSSVGASGLVNTVRERYNILVQAFELQPVIVDMRNTEYGVQCYAACYQRDLTERSGQGALRFTQGAKVVVFLGRDFFKGSSSYDVSTDATVGTLIHEFAHGSFFAVDVPPTYDNPLRWHPSYPPTAVTYASPDNSKQSSTPVMDRLVARLEPRAAIVNADNYGGFARELLMLEKK